MRYHSEYKSNSLTPNQALSVLVEGNQRFVTNLRKNNDLLQMVAQNREGQFPFAAILSCSDSRVPTELIFDQGLGDIFSARLAGNIASLKAIASLEYACKYLNSRIIVVLGHTRCGGVSGACDEVEMGNLNAIFSDIKPAIESETTVKENRTSSNPEFLDKVIHLNVQYQMQSIIDNSPLIRDYLAEEKVGIVGGYYDLDTGEVTFYEENQIFSIDSQRAGIQKNIATRYAS